jgi:hypothetical protein
VALHRIPELNNGAFVAVRGHPFIRGMIRRLEGNYEKAQAELMPSHRPGREGSVPFLMYAPRRFSPPRRTGPSNMWARGFGGVENLATMPALGGFDMVFAGSWRRRRIR